MRPVAADGVGNGLHQMRFAEAGAAVDKQRVVGAGRIFGDGERRGVRKAVRRADDKVVEGEFRDVRQRSRRARAALLAGNRFVGVEDDEIHVRRKDLAERFFHQLAVARGDDLFFIRRRGADNKTVLPQLDGRGVGKPDVNGNFLYFLFQKRQ